MIVFWDQPLFGTVCHLGEKHPAVWDQMWINKRLLLQPPFGTAPSWDLIVLQNPKPFKIDYPSRLSTLWDYVPVIILVIKVLSIKFPSRKTDQSHYWILVLIIVWILLVLLFYLQDHKGLVLNCSVKMLWKL